MFFQDIGRLSRHDVTQDAAADAGDHTQEDDEEMVAAVTGFPSGVDACYRERTETDGVQNVHDFLVLLNVSAAEQGRAQPEQDKEDNHRQKGGEYINRIAEHVWRNVSDHQVPQHSAAHGRYDSQNDDAEQIQLFTDRHHGSGGGEGDGSDDFYEKDNV